MAYKLKPGGWTLHGGWNAIRQTVNPKVVRYTTQHILRVMYLQELGLTWDQPIATVPHVLESWEKDYTIDVEYVISVTKLQEVPHYEITKEIAELELLENLNNDNLFKISRRRINDFLVKNPNALQISRPAIEWGFKHFKSITLDCQDCNFLKCPVTGKIFPYDVLNIDYMMRWGYLKLPIDKYWKQE